MAVRTCQYATFARHMSLSLCADVYQPWIPCNTPTTGNRRREGQHLAKPMDPTRHDATSGAAPEAATWRRPTTPRCRGAGGALVRERGPILAC
jgi:hypothetical protein